jgi:hypothetical protein
MAVFRSGALRRRRVDRIRAAATSPAQLAQLELLVIMEELLKRTESFALVPGQQPTIAIYPASGFSALPMRIL